ncbi:MAG: YkgJ family cysteine cluster protein [Desulfobacterales bacterium]
MKSTECKRCGTCCRKGGPSFHFEDKDLIEDGHIPAKHLYTIRKGEPVRDNICEKIVYAPSDIIKIKGQKNSWTCYYYEDEKKCGIYKYRPIECRALKCWDTREIEGIYGKSMLSRKDLFGKVEGLWELVIEYDERCSYEEITGLIRETSSRKTGRLPEKAAELIEYDNTVRELVVKKGNLDSDLLDFLFGRPLSVTLKTLVQI